jgi:hypothetical protein
VLFEYRESSGGAASRLPLPFTLPSPDTKWISPQPSTSAFRQAEYGHGELKITSATTATWTWIRNADPEPKETDSVTVTNIAA